MNSYMNLYIVISYQYAFIPYALMISYMKHGYDIMVSYSVISCVIYACIYDRVDYDIMGMISYLKL